MFNLKSTIFAALAAVALLAGCAKEPVLSLSDNTETLDYKACTYEVEVVTGGNWTLSAAEDYSWITPSATSGVAGDKITFSLQLNVTAKMRVAKFNIISGEQTKELIINQKNGALDAVLSLELVNVSTSAVFNFGITTKNPDDYKELGVYYATEADRSKAQRAVLATEIVSQEVTLEGLQANTDYYAWAFVAALTGEEIVSASPLKVVPPITVSDPAELQNTINNAAEFSVIRVLGGISAPNGIIMKSNITLVGGYNADFTEVTGMSTIEGAKGIPAVVVPEGTVGVVIQNFELTKGNADGSGDYSRGGGVHAMGDVTLENCNIHDNFAYARGGGIGSAGGGEFTVTVINCKITRNVCEDSHGAGIYNPDNSRFIMVNSLVAENWCQEPGGYAGGALFDGKPVIINCTFTKNYNSNESSWSYSAAVFRDDTERFAANNIFAGNFSHQYNGEQYNGMTIDQLPEVAANFNRQADQSVRVQAIETVPTVFKNNIIESSSEWGSVNTGNTVVPGPIDMTTFFTNWENGDYTLVAGCAAVEAGVTDDPTVAEYLAKYAKDLAGNTRVVGNRIDCGCYELQ